MTTATASPRVHQNSVRARRLQAFIGARASEIDKIDRNYVNDNPQAKQVSTETVDVFGAAGSYTFSFNGVAYTMVEDGTGANTTDVATQIAAFMENQGGIYGFVDVVAAVNVVTLTGKLPGYVFTLTDADAKLTSATTTAAADAAIVTFGRALGRTGFATGSVNDVEDASERAALATVGLFSAQVDTWTVADPGVGQYIDATISIEGLPEVIAVQTLWDTNLDTTLDNLAILLNAALTDLGYNTYVTVLGPGGAPGVGELEFTAAIAGVEFASMVTTDDTAGYPVITVASNKALATSLHRAFAGIALRVSDQENSATAGAVSTASYEANDTMLVAERGEVWVDNAQTVALGEQVFVDLTAAEGKFYNTAAANRVPLSRLRAEWVKSGRSIDSETIAQIRLR